MFPVCKSLQNCYMPRSKRKADKLSHISLTLNDCWCQYEYKYILIIYIHLLWWIRDLLLWCNYHTVDYLYAFVRITLCVLSEVVCRDHVSAFTIIFCTL